MTGTIMVSGLLGAKRRAIFTKPILQAHFIAVFVTGIILGTFIAKSEAILPKPIV